MAILRLPSLAYRQMRRDVIAMYKYTHKIYQVAVIPHTLDDNTSRRNNGFRIIKERCTHPQRRQFFGIHVNDIWNALPPEMVQAPSTKSFKSRLDKHWMNHYTTTDLRTIQYKSNSKTDPTTTQHFQQPWPDSIATCLFPIQHYPITEEMNSLTTTVTPDSSPVLHNTTEDRQKALCLLSWNIISYHLPHSGWFIWLHWIRGSEITCVPPGSKSN